MREIIFRGFYPDKDGKEKVFVNGELVKGTWVYGFYASKKETTYVFKEDYERNPVKTEHYIIVEQMTDWGLPNKFVAYPVIEETVGQYTGLTDKNGENIFEGDICSYENYVGVISFDEDECKFILTYDETDITDFSCIWGEELEVIGNIFENPELLEENKCKA